MNKSIIEQNYDKKIVYNTIVIVIWSFFSIVIAVSCFHSIFSSLNKFHFPYYFWILLIFMLLTLSLSIIVYNSTQLYFYNKAIKKIKKQEILNNNFLTWCYFFKVEGIECQEERYLKVKKLNILIISIVINYIGALFLLIINIFYNNFSKVFYHFDKSNSAIYSSLFLIICFFLVTYYLISKIIIGIFLILTNYRENKILKVFSIITVNYLLYQKMLINNQESYNQYLK